MEDSTQGVLNEWRRQRGCVRKRSYRCRKEAKAAIRRYKQKFSRAMRCYKCPHCCNYHLTSHRGVETDAD